MSHHCQVHMWRVRENTVSKNSFIFTCVALRLYLAAIHFSSVESVERNTGTTSETEESPSGIRTNVTSRPVVFLVFEIIYRPVAEAV